MLRNNKEPRKRNSSPIKITTWINSSLDWNRQKMKNDLNNPLFSCIKHTLIKFHQKNRRFIFCSEWQLFFAGNLYLNCKLSRNNNHPWQSLLKDNQFLRNEYAKTGLKRFKHLKEHQS